MSSNNQRRRVINLDTLGLIVPLPAPLHASIKEIYHTGALNGVLVGPLSGYVLNELKSMSVVDVLEYIKEQYADDFESFTSDEIDFVITPNEFNDRINALNLQEGDILSVVDQPGGFDLKYYILLPNNDNRLTLQRIRTVDFLDETMIFLPDTAIGFLKELHVTTGNPISFELLKQLYSDDDLLFGYIDSKGEKYDIRFTDSTESVILVVDGIPMVINRDPDIFKPSIILSWRG